MAELVDWDLARRVAALGIGGGSSAMASRPDLSGSGARASAAVCGYTGLEPQEALPEPEWVGRREWVEINLVAVRDMIGAVAARLGDSAVRRPVVAVAGRALAVEIGALLGFASRHVLGQYEYPLLGGERPSRLLFVGENIDAAAGQLGAEPGRVLDWIALHEVTHSVQFAATPWLRTHIGDLARTLLAEAPLRMPAGDVIDRARRIASTDPRRTLAEIRASDPVSLLAPARSVAIINDVQATMASIEGYAEHVMDAAAGELDPAVTELRTGLERRRRNRSTPVRLLSWLLGLELKLRQYEEGKRFCDAIAMDVGVAGLNAAWDGPQALPDLDELRDPEAWIARVLSPAAAA